VTLTTGWAVAITCYSHSAKHRKNGKWQISIPQGAKTPKLILMKPFTVDYVQNPTPRDYFSGGSATWVVWANM